MNYGYSEQGKELKLEAGDEKNRYAIQLYNQLAVAIPIADKDILEVGSGRGGGLNYIYQQFSPKSATGIDLNEKAIAFCLNQYNSKALRFIRGNAENLPISTACMDIVINVESSHGYPHIDKFFSEVNRVLKPGGYFLFADFRPKSNVSDLLKNIHESGLKIISERWITENVVAALDLIHTAREQQIGRLVPFMFRGMSRQFTALKGTSMYNSFKSGDFEYVLFIIQK